MNFELIFMALFGSNENTGIDIGAGSIKVVRIERSGKRPKLLSAAIIEAPIEAEMSGAALHLRSLLAEKKIGTKNVMALMPGKDLSIRSFTLPKMPIQELDEAVRWEAKRHISFPLEAALIEYLIVGERREGMASKLDILMVAAERSKVITHIKPIAEAKIQVAAVDANALALRNVYHLLEKPEHVNTVVVDMGAGKTEIDIFKGGVLRFSRCLEVGGLDMTRALSEAISVGFQEAEKIKCEIDMINAPQNDEAAALIRTSLDQLLMEIRRSVDYYKTTYREKDVDNTLLTGGVALMTGLKEYFERSLEGTVELDQPFGGLSVRKELESQFGAISPRFSAAIGLALRKG